jgi:hypothetical protein
MKIASKRYYDSNKFIVNKNRILAKIKNEKDYVPKLSTLIKYKIEATPKKTKLEESIDLLEAEAIKRVGKTTFKELQKEARRRIANEAPGTVIVENLSNLTEAERTKRKEKLVVTLPEIEAALNRLRDNEHLTAGSAKKYFEQFGEIVGWLGGDAQSNVIELLKDPPKVEEKILKGFKKRRKKTGEPYSLNSLKDYYSPITTLCLGGRNYLPAYCEGVDLKAYSNIMKREKTSGRINVINLTKTGTVLRYSDIESALKNIRKTDPNSTNHMILLLYNYNAWRDDLGDLKVYDGNGNPPNNTQNYYSVKQNKIFLRSYKTVREYGAKEYGDLPAEVAKIFKIQNKAEGGNKKYLISKKDGEMYSKGKIATLVPTAFAAGGAKDKANINEIRKSTVTNLWKNPKTTNDQKQKLADKMGHSTLVAYTVYVRKDFNEDTDSVPKSIDGQLKLLDTTRVAKVFDGKIFFGQAPTKPDADGLYPVIYDDGDTEDYSESDFKKYSALAIKEKSKDKKKK